VTITHKTIRAFMLLMAAACASTMDADGRPCPCAVGYVCCTATNRCVRDTRDCRSQPDASVSDARVADSGDRDARPVDDGGRRDDEDSGDDAGAVDGSAAGPPAIPTSLVLKNVGKQPYYLGNCHGRWAEIVRPSDSSVSFTTACRACSDRYTAAADACVCDPFNDEATCRSAPLSMLIMPGESSTFAWDGVLVQKDNLEAERVPDHGEALKLRLCPQRPFHGPRMFMPPPCIEHPFVYGTDLEVTLEVDPAREPEEVGVWPQSMTLVNEQLAVELLKEHCGTVGWFELDMGDRFSIANPRACPCDESYQPTRCSEAPSCGPDVSVTLETQQTLALDWDGTFWYRHPSGCAAQYRMPVALYIGAKICWRQVGGDTLHCEKILHDSDNHRGNDRFYIR